MESASAKCCFPYSFESHQEDLSFGPQQELDPIFARAHYVSTRPEKDGTLEELKAGRKYIVLVTEVLPLSNMSLPEVGHHHVSDREPCPLPVNPLNQPTTHLPKPPTHHPQTSSPTNFPPSSVNPHKFPYHDHAPATNTA